MSPSRYVADANGLRYHWATSPAFECPNADALVYTAAEDGDGEGEWTLRPATADAITAAAVALGADALLLARVLRSRHQAQGVQRLRVDEQAHRPLRRLRHEDAPQGLTRRGSPSRQPTRRRSGSRRGSG